MNITKDTRLKDLISTYPWLKNEMAKVNDKFKDAAYSDRQGDAWKSHNYRDEQKIRHGRRRFHKQDIGSYQSA